MTRLGLRPWRDGDATAPRSVPVTVVVLTLDEEANIARCLASAGWADQVVVVDAGSADATVALARSLGAQVIEQPWLGFSGQREFALRLAEARNDWVYFVDADEWVSPQLAAEIAGRLRAPDCAAYSHRLRLVFQGTWIRHCGWYSGSWVVRLVDRRYTKYDGSLVGERARVDGPVARLVNDIVDEDRKGLARWLHKHVRYAELEQRRRGAPVPLGERIRRFRARDRTDTRPLARVILKDLVFPAIPAGEVQQIAAAAQPVRHGEAEPRFPAAILQVVGVEMDCRVILRRVPPAMLLPGPVRAHHAARRQVHHAAVTLLRTQIGDLGAVDVAREIPGGQHVQRRQTQRLRPAIDRPGQHARRLDLAGEMPRRRVGVLRGNQHRPARR